MNQTDLTKANIRLRLDNNSILEFFSSTAAVMNQRGLISQKDTDNLRIVINGIQSSEASRNKPVVLQFLKQNSEFCSFLENRYGPEGLYQNILRHTTRSSFVDMRSLLSAFGNELIDKSKLFLNRSVSLYRGGKLDQKVLYSSLLVDTAEILEHSGNCIDQIVKELSLMVPHGMEGGEAADLELDQEISQALGFSGLYFGSMPNLSERRMRQLASFAIDTIASCLLELARKLSYAAVNEDQIKLSITAENLRLEGQRLANAPSTESTDIGQWEIKRQSMLGLLFNINAMVKELAKGTLKLLQEVGLQEADKTLEVSEGVKRRIKFDLVTKGIGNKDAHKATSQLVEYLSHHNVEPKDIIVSELSKIHQCLSTSSLNILQTLCGQSGLQKFHSEEKGKTLKKAESLKKVFSQHVRPAGKLVFSLVFMFLNSSCGLKTAPISKTLDFRPEIPFHGAGFKLTKPGKHRDKTADQIKIELRKVQEQKEL